MRVISNTKTDMIYHELAMCDVLARYLVKRLEGHDADKCKAIREIVRTIAYVLGGVKGQQLFNSYIAKDNELTQMFNRVVEEEENEEKRNIM